MQDGCVRVLGTLQENGLSYKCDGDMEIVKVNKGSLEVMRAYKIMSNIYKLLGSIVVDDVMFGVYDIKAYLQMQDRCMKILGTWETIFCSV